MVQRKRQGISNTYIKSQAWPWEYMLPFGCDRAMKARGSLGLASCQHSIYCSACISPWFQLQGIWYFLLASEDICTGVHIHTHNLKNLRSYYIYLLLCMYVPVYIWVCTCHGKIWEDQRTMWRSWFSLSFGHVGLGDWTHTVRMVVSNFII